MSTSDKSGQSQKPPDYDEEFTQAVDKFREQHKLYAEIESASDLLLPSKP